MLFQREKIVNTESEASIDSQYIWKIRIKETEEKKIIMLTRPMI